MTDKISTTDEQEAGIPLYLQREKLNQKITGATVVWSIALALVFEKAVDAFFEWTGWFEDSSLLSWIVVLIWGIIFLLPFRRWNIWKGQLHRLDESAGTIYYLWAQPGNRLAVHQQAIPVLRDTANDLRAIIRRFSGPNPESPVYDLTVDLENMYSEFERSTNDDDEVTSFQIVPDLIWPLAFRLGNLWFPRSDKIEFIELVAKKDNRAKHTGASLRWQWEEVKTGSGYPEMSQPNSDHSPVPYFVDYFRHAPDAPRERELKVPSELATNPGLCPDGLHVERVKLVLCLSSGNCTTGSFAEPDFEDRGKDDEPYDVIRIVAPFVPAATGETDEGPTERKRRFEKAHIRKTFIIDRAKATELSDQDMNIEAAQLARVVAQSIADTLDEFPAAIVELHARVPKTVAFAAGLLITEMKSTSKKKGSWDVPTDYWSRLSLMYFDVDSQKTFKVKSHSLEASWKLDQR